MDVSVDNQRLPNKRIDMDEVNAKGNGANLLDYRFFMYAVYLELCKIQKQENCSKKNEGRVIGDKTVSVRRDRENFHA